MRIGAAKLAFAKSAGPKKNRALHDSVPDLATSAQLASVRDNLLLFKIGISRLLFFAFFAFTFGYFSCLDEKEPKEFLRFINCLGS